MGPGFRANVTIGRAVKLALLNTGCCTPGEISKSIHGMPGRFTFLLRRARRGQPVDNACNSSIPEAATPKAHDAKVLSDLKGKRLAYRSGARFD